MKSTMVGVKEKKQLLLARRFFKEKIAKLMPGVKSFKIQAQALSLFTHTDVH
jgi:hypothetical protein